MKTTIIKFLSVLVSLAGAISLSTFLAGCGSLDTSELTAVNKVWNKMIRASHIYPIYPLTQDIQPGDIFLTDSDIEETQAWEKAGYLRLDHHLARLYPEKYSDFYKHSFVFDAEDLPKLWLHNNSWSTAPAAAFPTYSFSAKQGAGANVALPISGIPIGLGLMGARSASGFVSIGDARTYGIDELSLMSQVRNFVKAQEQEIAAALGVDLVKARKETKEKMNRRFYIQTVSRVYTTGKVTVSMVNDSSYGGSISGGMPKDVPIPDVQATNAAANYANLLSAVNTNLASLAAAAAGAAAGAGAIVPGGTLKFTAVSSRSVSMNETFTNPVVIGYTGFSWPLEVDVSGRAPVVKLSDSGPTSYRGYFHRAK